MKLSKKITLAAISSSIVLFGSTGVASAHAVVTPSDAQTGTRQTFRVEVPTERDSPTTQVKIDIPMTVGGVIPNVKDGWKVETTKHDVGDESMIATITWSGGQIGVGLRDSFEFSAKTSDEPGDIQWNIYQTYGDGHVVSWNQAGGSELDDEEATSGPFSVTKVTTNTAQDVAIRQASDEADDAKSASDKALYTAIAGVVLALAAIAAVVIPLARGPKAPSQRL